jgi:tetratricopeptide (TPR) repeat protein
VQARLGEANTLQAFARFHSRRGDFDCAEQLFAEALEIYYSLGDRYSIAATLTYRGQHRLAGEDARAGGDWALALILSIGTEPFLARQIITMTFGETRRRCASCKDDEFLAAAVTSLLGAAEDAIGSFHLTEDQVDTLTVVLAAFRLIGAICVAQSVDDHGEREHIADTARNTAQQLDMATDNAFRLAELVQQRLGAGSSPPLTAPTDPE